MTSEDIPEFAARNRKRLSNFSAFLFISVIVCALAGAGLDLFLLSWRKDPAGNAAPWIFISDLILGTGFGWLLLWSTLRLAPKPPSVGDGVGLLVLSGTGIGTVIGMVNGLILMRVYADSPILVLSAGVGMVAGLVASLLAAIPFSFVLRALERPRSGSKHNRK